MNENCPPSSSTSSSSAAFAPVIANIPQQNASDFTFGMLTKFAIYTKPSVSQTKSANLRQHMQHCLLYEFGLKNDVTEAHQNLQTVYGDDAPSMVECERHFSQFAKERILCAAVKKEPEEKVQTAEEANKMKALRVQWSRNAHEKKRLRKEAKQRKLQNARKAMEKKKREEEQKLESARHLMIVGQNDGEQEDQPVNENLRNASVQTVSTIPAAVDLNSHWLRPQPPKSKMAIMVANNEENNMNIKNIGPLNSEGSESRLTRKEARQRQILQWMNKAKMEKKMRKEQNKTTNRVAIRAAITANKEGSQNDGRIPLAQWYRQRKALAMELYNVEPLNSENAHSYVGFDSLDWPTKEHFFDKAQCMMTMLPHIFRTNYTAMIAKALKERGSDADLYQIIGHVLMHGSIPDDTPKKIILDSILNALGKFQAGRPIADQSPSARHRQISLPPHQQQSSQPAPSFASSSTSSSAAAASSVADQAPPLAPTFTAVVRTGCELVDLLNMEIDNDDNNLKVEAEEHEGRD